MFISLECFSDNKEKLKIIELIEEELSKNFLFLDRANNLYSTSIELYVKSKINNNSKILLDIAEILEFYDKKIKNKLNDNISIITENYFDSIIINNDKKSYIINGKNIVNIYNPKTPDLSIVKYNLSKEDDNKRNFIKKYTNRVIGVLDLNETEFRNGLNYHLNFSKYHYPKA